MVIYSHQLMQSGKCKMTLAWAQLARFAVETQESEVLASGLSARLRGSTPSPCLTAMTALLQVEGLEDAIRDAMQEPDQPVLLDVGGHHYSTTLGFALLLPEFAVVEARSHPPAIPLCTTVLVLDDGRSRQATAMLSRCAANVKDMVHMLSTAWKWLAAACGSTSCAIRGCRNCALCNLVAG